MTRDDEVVHAATPPAAARVICPRCRVGEITYGSSVCPLCGFSPATGEVVEDPLPAALDEAVRRELGQELRIERLLGRGGMSLVYLAREIELNRLVAVKVLPLRLSMGADAAERFNAYLEDYGLLAGAMIDLYEASLDPRYLLHARAFAGAILDRFLDRDGGGFFFTSDDHEQLIARTKPAFDGSTPSGNSLPRCSRRVSSWRSTTTGRPPASIVRCSPASRTMQRRSPGSSTVSTPSASGARRCHRWSI